MSTRLTKVDWQIINEALAMFETEADDADRPKRYWDRVGATREKIWERLGPATS